MTLAERYEQITGEKAYYMMLNPQTDIEYREAASEYVSWIETNYEPFADLVRIENQPNWSQGVCFDNEKLMRKGLYIYYGFANIEEQREAPSKDHEPVRIKGIWYWSKKE